MSGALSMWAVYDHPLDDPDHFVARRWEITAGESHATDDVLRETEIDEIRRHLAMRGFCSLMRNESDDPVIVESWI